MTVLSSWISILKLSSSLMRQWYEKAIVNQMDPLFPTNNVKILVALVGYISTAVW